MIAVVLVAMLGGPAPTVWVDARPVSALLAEAPQDPLYKQGTAAIDRGDWDAAVKAFGELARQKGERADAALYWQAYALYKGGQPDAMRIINSAPGLEDVWQIHFSQLSGQEYTQPGLFIANTFDEALPAMPVQPIAAPAPGPNAPPPPAHNGPAFWFKIQAKQDGSFSVTNQRNGFSKTYTAR